MSDRPAQPESTLPTKHLPGVSAHDLPEPVRLRRITGASVIILATALGSGEYVLWPYITSQVGFVFEEGQALQRNIAPWFGVAFWLAGMVALLSTNLGIIDYTARLIADQVKIHALARNRFWSESKLYVAVVWLLIASGSVILLLGIEEPFLLVVISSSVAGVQMFLYSALLVVLNRTALPRPLRIGWPRVAVLLATFVFFGILSVLTVLAILRGESVA
ncbi:Nramp family divalent metal transporter [Bounagaea algeriensis]